MAHDLRERLRQAPIPEERGARERGWRVIRAAYAERHPVRRPTGPAVRLAIAAGLAALVLALALTPAGAEVADLVDSAVSPGAKHAEPTLTHVPGGGSLLVESASGPWVVNQDGSRRRLGDYGEAAWSAGGHFVAVTAGHELSAVEPTATDAVRWSIPSDRRVTDPSWSTSGVKVAYLSGRSLRIVAGDGTDDRMLAGHVASVAPAWQPQRHPLPPSGQAYGPHTNVLAYVTRSGQVVVSSIGVDNSARVLVRLPRDSRPEGLSWSADGRLLMSWDRHGLVTYDLSNAARRPLGNGMPPGMALAAAAFAPHGDRVAAITTRTGPSGRQSALIVSRPGADDFTAKQLFAGPGRFTDLAWSPQGNSLVVGWPDADQWLFLNPRTGQVTPVGDITDQFDAGATSPVPFPQIAGWCCTELGTSSP
jgi:hypothetical protein